MAETIIQFSDREERLTRLTEEFELLGDYPLLKVARLPDVLAERLRNAANMYLYVTIEAFYPEQPFQISDDLTLSAAEALRGLPNISPNGLVLPKKQTYLAYNLLHATVANIFRVLGFARHIVSAHVPLNLRLVDGQSDPRVDLRPHASAKWHSDLWAGDPAAGIVVFLPILGAEDSLGVRWLEPKTFPVELMRPLDNFNEGAYLKEGGREYEVGFKPGTIIFCDPCMLHATQRDSDGLRFSVDFRFFSRYPLTSDKYAPGQRPHNYYLFDDWIDIGRGRTLMFDAPLAPFDSDDGATKSKYPASFVMRALDE